MELHLTFKPSLESLGTSFKNIAISNFVSKVINETAAKVERFGKQLSPVDTGRLRASIHFSPSTLGMLKAIIETGTDYAIFVHEGTRYMRGRPFMETGAQMGVANMAGDISDKIESEFVRAFKSLH